MRESLLRIVVLVLALLPGQVVANGQLQIAGPLVSAEWLNDNKARPEIVMLDIRSPRPNRHFYNEGHIAGSVAAPYNTGWRKTVDGVVGMLPPLEEISAHISSLGVSNKSHVVILPFGNSSTDFSAATRVYWTFKVLGHDAVSILDGGYAAWLANGFGLSIKQVKPNRKSFKANYRPELVASQDDVKRVREGQAMTSLVDARPTAQYSGKAKSPVVARAGTIPGSKNLQQSSLYNPRKGSFADLEIVETLRRKNGLSDEGATITFCNTGHWATIAWFALSEVAGKENIAVYDGSMTEWTSDPENPVERTLLRLVRDADNRRYLMKNQKTNVVNDTMMVSIDTTAIPARA